MYMVTYYKWVKLYRIFRQKVKHVNPFFEVIIFMQYSYGLLWKVEKI